MEQIEREFKNLLTQDEYRRLVDHYHADLTTNISQTNSYFDCNGILAQHHSALRIRMIEHNSTGEITLKLSLAPNEIQEITEVFPSSDLEEILQKGELHLPSSIHTALQKQEIHQQVFYLTHSLKTERLEGFIQEHLLVLDHSFYGNHEDYELEIEVSDLKKGRHFFEQVLEQFQISIRPTPSKIVRASQKD